jgi:hypothetical protein
LSVEIPIDQTVKRTTGFVPQPILLAIACR